jgi:hypothetical protein
MILQITPAQTYRCGLMSSSTYQPDPQEYLHDRVCKTSESWSRKELTYTRTGTRRCFRALRDRIMDIFWSLNRGVYHNGLFQLYERTSSFIAYIVPTVQRYTPK